MSPSDNSHDRNQPRPQRDISPLLLLNLQDGTQKTVILNRRLFTIGRKADNDLSVDFVGVSRYHAQIERIHNSYFLQDLGSRFGTFVNNQMITKKQLQHLDRITLGNLKDVEIVFHVDPLKEELTKYPEKTPSHTFPFTLETFTKLTMLLEVSQTTQVTLNLKEILDEIVKSVIKLSNADRGYILLKDDRGDLAFKVAKIKDDHDGDFSSEISWGVVNKVMETGKPQVTGDVKSDHELKKHDSIISLRLQSIMCIPLFSTHITEDVIEKKTALSNSADDLIGVIYVDSRASNKIYSYEDVRILETLASNASVAISNAKLFQNEKNKSRQLQKVYVDTVRVLANSIEARDIYTRGHAERVAAITEILAHEMQWDPERIYYLKIGAYLHDIGKIGVPDAILNKKDTLTEEEYAVMKQHPQIGERIILGIDFLEPVIPYLLFHQERFDGSGYPYGLKGSEIPVEGRLMAIPDVFDALTSNRPYRGPVSFDQALHELQAARGILYDPEFVDIFARCYFNGKIPTTLSTMKFNLNTDFSLLK